MDIPHYIKTLDKNTGDVLQLLKECSEEQFEQKTGDAWSILEILEHMLVADLSVYILLMRPSQKMGEKAEVIGSAGLKKMMIDLRDKKFPAPQLLFPKGRIKTEAEFIERFLRQRGELIDALEKEDIIIDNGIVAHPAIGDMSKTDWLNFLIHHSERHISQIKERLANLNKAS